MTASSGGRIQAADYRAVLEQISAAETSGDHAAGVRLCRHALELARRDGDRLGQAFVLRQLARFHTWQGELELAAGYCEDGRKALIDPDTQPDRADELQDGHLRVVQAFALNLIGMNDEAMELLSYAQAVAERLADAELLYWVHNRIGLVYDDVGDSRTSRELLLRALDLSAVMPDKDRWSVVTNLVHNALSYLPELRAAGRTEDADAVQAQALAHARWSVDWAEEQIQPFMLSLALGNLGAILNLAGDTEGALGACNRSYEIAVEHGYKTNEMSALQHQATALLAQGRTDEAVDVLSDVLARSLQLNDPLVQQSVLRVLSDVYEARGDYAAALASFRRFYTVEQQIRSERAEARGRVLAHQAQLEDARVDAERARAHNQQLIADKQALEEQTVELARRADSDALTGVHNRRRIDVVLPQLFEQAVSNDRELCVAVLDLDHFKQVNDNYGHAVGDEVLIRVAQLISANSRDTDLVARYGGEEFLLAFADAGLPAATRLCERLRTNIEAADWAAIRPDLQITLSIGVCPRQDASSALDLIERADRNLYRAKALGRNRVVAERPDEAELSMSGTG